MDTAEALLTPLVDFMATELIDPPDIVQGLIPASGVVVLAGQPKSKKTFLLLNLYASLIDGRPFLGRAVMPTPAAFFFLEGRPAAIQKRLRRIISLGDFGRHQVAIHPRAFRLDTRRGLDQLCDAIDATGVRVIVVDPLVFAHRQDENSNTQMGALLHELADFAHARGVVVILVHHLAKGGPEDDMRAIRGASAIPGATEANLRVQVRRGGVRLSIEGRDVEEQDSMSLAFDKETFGFTVADPSTSAPGSSPDDHQERVWAVVLRRGAPVDVKSLANLVSLSAPTVQKCLNALVEEGRVQKLPEKRGKAFLYCAAA